MAWESKSKLIQLDVDRYNDGPEKRKVKDLDDELCDILKDLDTKPNDQGVINKYLVTRMEANELVGKLIEKDNDRRNEENRLSTTSRNEENRFATTISYSRRSLYVALASCIVSVLALIISLRK